MKEYVKKGIDRIVELYEKTNGNCVLSFSGGKDSTVVVELYLMAKEKGMVGNIDIIFADTQVEYDVIYKFVDWFSKNKQEVIYIKPTKPFGQVLKEYGKPAMSKMKSEMLSTVQNTGDPLATYRGKNLLGYGEFKDISHHKIANKHMHFLHPNHETMISNRCCNFVKKQPFDNYYSKHNIDGFLTGIRISEGGIRSMAYSGYQSSKMVKGKEVLHYLPIFDWTDDNIEEFLKDYNVKISEAYTKYGLDRTGCIGCPFAKDIYKNLEVLYQYEPKKYKAVQHWLGDVYRDLEVALPFDDEYMKLYYKRLPEIEKRRNEMLEKYRPEVKIKNNNQINIFE